MQAGGFTFHPHKTQLGRLDKGFDWLGLWFGSNGQTMAQRALYNHNKKRQRLYYQARKKAMSESATQERVRIYEI